MLTETRSAVKPFFKWGPQLSFFVPFAKQSQMMDFFQEYIPTVFDNYVVTLRIGNDSYTLGK